MRLQSQRIAFDRLRLAWLTCAADLPCMPDCDWTSTYLNSLTHSFNCSLTHALTYSSPHSLTPSLSRPLSRGFTHSYARSLTHSLTHPPHPPPPPPRGGGGGAPPPPPAPGWPVGSSSAAVYRPTDSRAWPASTPRSASCPSVASTTSCPHSVETWWTT